MSELFDVNGSKMHGGAEFSDCRTWRYTLWRWWGEIFSDDATYPKGMCAFIGLNPSTADETKNDPTVTRCINFAKSWGYSGMYMLNAFAYRETDAKLAMAYKEPVGPENNYYLGAKIKNSELVVAAWGAQKGISARVAKVTAIAEKAGKQLHCLKKTKDGHPWHPLYVKGDTKPILFQ